MSRNSAVHLSREAAQCELGALADRVASEPMFGPDAKTDDEAVLDGGTRVVLAEATDAAKLTVAVKVSLRPKLAARTADPSR